MRHDARGTRHGAVSGAGPKADSDDDDKHYDAVIVMGGDGIVHEALNGLLGPPHQQRCCQQQVASPPPLLGVIGCGTSNGLASSLAHAAHEHSDRLAHAFLIAKGATVAADLAEYCCSVSSSSSSSYWGRQQQQQQ